MLIIINVLLIDLFKLFWLYQRDLPENNFMIIFYYYLIHLWNMSILFILFRVSLWQWYGLKAFTEDLK